MQHSKRESTIILKKMKQKIKKKETCSVIDKN